MITHTQQGGRKCTDRIASTRASCGAHSGANSNGDPHAALEDRVSLVVLQIFQLVVSWGSHWWIRPVEIGRAENKMWHHRRQI
jgi:hypothetical protein